MSLNGIISNAYSGLATSQAVLRSISNNIANVNTVGYARERVQLESIATSQGGAGVKIGTIERVADRFLEQATFTASGQAGRFDTLSKFHNRLQGLIGTTSSDSLVSARLDSVFKAFSDLAVDPANTVLRRNIVSEIERFSEEISRLSAGVQGLHADASNQLEASTQQINALIGRVAALNPEIVKGQVTGTNTSGLIEQRNQALNELSALVDLEVQNQPDGSVLLSTSGGLVLLDEFPRRLEYNSPSVAAPETNFPAVRITRFNPATQSFVETGFTLEQSLTGGSAKALLDLRDVDLVNVADNLGELARAFTDEINRIHNSNVAVPPPAFLSGRNTGLLATDPNRFSGQTTFSVVNQAGVVTASTTLDFNALGPNAPLSDVINAINTGLGGAATASFTNGVLRLQTTAPGTGVAIADDPANPSVRGTRGFSHFFGLNDLINPPQPVHLDTGVQPSDPHGFNAGGTTFLELRDQNNRVVASTTLTLAAGGTYQDILNQLNAPGALGNFVTFSFDAQGRLTPTNNPGFFGQKIQVVSDTTARGGTQKSFTSYFGIGQGVLASAAQELSVKAEVRNNPQAIALAKLDPSLGVGSFALGPGDFRGAASFRDMNIAQVAFRASGNLPAITTSLSNFAGALLGDAALTADRAQTGVTDSVALRDSVRAQRDDFSGVNLDEELGMMVVFQNSYSASARLISTARELYDALLNII
jgi:flagellar hook-associated protein 1